MVDTKDWTWVIERPCPECGFDTATLTRASVAGVIRDVAMAWPPLLSRAGARTRPSEDVWSALEYGCHVRDVFGVYDGRLVRMLEEDDPLYPNWDQDATAAEDGYEAQEPRVVALELEAAGQRLAARFDGASGELWDRSGRRSDGAQFTIETFARYLVHDLVHHLDDVAKGYEAIDGAARP